MKIKIIDFGIAGAISFFTQEDLDTGSLSYMAPECFSNQKDYKVDGRIDVWATGVILYCMLHGHLPFKGNNSYEIIESIKSGNYRIDPLVEKNVSDACIDVLKQCLEVNAKKRISMEELADHMWI
jgi:serine/threonine protein kinase